ncbi:MAG: cation transporter [Proteobacteria bacterium]|nr:cation transporter [Pseudomonadota bacterium]
MGHSHQYHSQSNLKGKKLGLSILLNILITLGQVWGGMVSGSLSLLSDALHNFSDVVALLISYIADRMTQLAYTPEKTFGYKRAEVIAALINASSLIIIAILLTKEALIRFQDPVDIGSVWVIGLAAASILVNGGSVLLLKGDAKTNINIRSAYLHLLTDMITSIIVLLGGVAMYFFQIYWLDSVLSILIAIYLCYSATQLLLDTLKMLMQFSPGGIDLQELEEVVLTEPHIESLHHVHIWQLNDQDIHFEAHIDFKRDILLSKTSEIIAGIKKVLGEKFGIHHVLLQPEFGVHDDKNLIVDERNLVRH